MLKSLSAAALALSLIAAPAAFAQGSNPAGITAPATKPAVHQVHKTQKHALNTKHRVKHVAKAKAKPHKHVAHKHSVKKHVAKVKTPKTKAAI